VIKADYDRALETEDRDECFLIMSRSLVRFYGLNRDIFIFSLVRVYGNRHLKDTGKQLALRGVDLGADWLRLRNLNLGNHAPPRLCHMFQGIDLEGLQEDCRIWNPELPAFRIKHSFFDKNLSRKKVPGTPALPQMCRRKTAQRALARLRFFVGRAAYWRRSVNSLVMRSLFCFYIHSVISFFDISHLLL
jgi:hypothetical protein